MSNHKNDFKEAICARFEKEIPDGLKYVLPDNSTEPMIKEKEWCQLIIQHSPGRLIGLRGAGMNRYERVGHIIVRTHLPPDEGTERGDEVSTIIENMFEGRSLEGFGCRFSAVHTRETGKDNKGRYKVLLTDAFFVYREIK